MMNVYVIQAVYFGVCHVINNIFITRLAMIVQ